MLIHGIKLLQHVVNLHCMQVLPFFESMGFRLPERKGIADFLQVSSCCDDANAFRLCSLTWCIRHT